MAIGGINISFFGEHYLTVQQCVANKEKLSLRQQQVYAVHPKIKKIPWQKKRK